MNCVDCGSRLEVIKTMVLEATTQRLRECGCGSRFLTTEVVTRKLPALPVTGRQPPGNSSPQSSSPISSAVPSAISKADPDQTPARVEPIVETFGVVGKDGPTWGLTETAHAKLTKAFPGVNAKAEYAKVALWLESNPQRRKTGRGMKAFLMRWFEKAQNNSGRVVKPVTPLETFDSRRKREREDAVEQESERLIWGAR